MILDDEALQPYIAADEKVMFEEGKGFEFTVFQEVAKCRTLVYGVSGSCQLSTTWTNAACLVEYVCLDIAACFRELVYKVGCGNVLVDPCGPLNLSGAWNIAVEVYVCS